MDNKSNAGVRRAKGGHSSDAGRERASLGKVPAETGRQMVREVFGRRNWSVINTGNEGE